LKKSGVVIAVEGSDVVIRSQRESSCGSCAGKSACGTLGSWEQSAKKEKDNNEFDIRLPNTLHAVDGDVVTVEVPDSLILTASLMFYGVPVFAFLVCGAVGSQLALHWGASEDVFSAIGGLFGAISTWLWLMKRPNTMEMPEMIAVESVKRDHGTA